MALLVTGCRGSDPPSAFEDRPELADCGEASYTNARTELAPSGPVDCLKRALAEGGEAELRVRVQTVEGDDVGWWVRSLGDGGGEVFVDASGDSQRGGPAWLKYVCADLDFGVDGLPLFGSDTCAETVL